MLSKAQSDSPTATPSRVKVDKTQIEVDGEKKWLYAAINTESKLLLEINLFSRPQNALRSGVRTRRCASRQRRGTDPAAFTRTRVISETIEHAILRRVEYGYSGPCFVSRAGGSSFIYSGELFFQNCCNEPSR